MGTNYQWAALVISRALCPVTQNNCDNFVRWMAAENPPSDWWHLDNPLNCGLDDGSADGTGAYPDLDIAAAYSARVIRQANMAPIWLALHDDADLATFSAGCAASAWSTGGYHGQPGYIASIPQPAAIESGQSFPVVPIGPAPAPAPVPPLPLPIQEETMSLELLPNGTAVISAVGAGSRAEHLLVFTLNPTDPNNPDYNVLDVTDGIGTADPYTVVSA
jgi:hypothetical protein